MTRKTRLFLLISAAVLVVGLGTGLLTSYMGVGLQTLTILSSDNPTELVYVPRDTEIIVSANVRNVMDSELRQKLLQLRPQSLEDRGNDFEAATGINIERDIDTLMTSLGGGSAEPARALIVARGSFDKARIEELVRERGGQTEEYKGERILALTKDDHALGLSLVEADLVVYGLTSDVRRAIDARLDASRNVTTNDELMNLIRDVDGGNLWAVGRFNGIARKRLPDAVSAQLPPIKWFTATGRINGGLQGVVRGEADNDQAATDLREVIRGFVALARLQTRRSAELRKMLSSLQLGGEGRTVSLAFSVPPEVIEALAAMQRPREAEK